MDRETRINQKKVRSQKASADKHIWAKVPPEVRPIEEIGQARRSSPRRIIFKEDHRGIKEQ